MANNTKKSSQDMAEKASDILKNNNSSSIQKSLAGSVLSQTNTKNQTGKEMEKKASDVLKSAKYNKETKSLAGSVLSQSNKKR